MTVMLEKKITFLSLLNIYWESFQIIFCYLLSPFSAQNKHTIYRLSKRTLLLPFTMVNNHSSAIGKSHETCREYE